MPGLKKTLVATTSAIAVVTLLAATPSQAAPEEISLTALDGYPDRATWVERFKNYFVPEVNKLLASTGNYKINWNLALNGQIVKPRKVLGGLQRGLGDIGVVTTIFHPDKLPMYSVSFQTPFSTTDPRLVTRVIDDMVDRFPAMRNVWDKYNQVYLTNGVALDSYQLFLKKPAKKPGDLNGLKILAGGDNQKYIKAWGATPVSGPLTSYRDKVKGDRSIAQGAIIWPQAAGAFGFGGLTPYMLELDIGNVASKAINVNKQTWDKLPAEVRGALKTAAIGYRDQMADVAVKKGQGLLKKYLKDGGQVIKFTTEERKLWVDSLPPLAKEWAANLEKDGLPGRQMLAYYMDRLRQANQPIIRQWDKE